MTSLHGFGASFRLTGLDWGMYPPRPMKTHRAVLALAVLTTLAAPFPALAGGLRIRANFVGQGLPPKPGLITGGGDIQQIFAVAAKAWERLFRKGGDKWIVQIDYDWGAPDVDLGTNQFGKEYLVEQSSKPLRITRSRVFFTNNPPREGLPNDGWFADPTPEDNSEYLTYASREVAVGKGSLNVGRVFGEGRGDADHRIDLLTIAMHEIGHSLGLDDEFVGYQQALVGGAFIPITSPRPHAGIRLVLAFNQSHLAGVFFPEADDPDFGDQVGANEPLMVPVPTPGARQLISGTDALAVAQLSSFKHPTLPKR